MDYNEVTRGGSDYIGYDYKTVAVSGDKASLYLDAYKNFGWQSDDSAQTRQIGGTANLKVKLKLKLKRDRKILNKVELTRLGQHFESCMDEITALENSSTRSASIYSTAVGLIGTAFMAGSVFAVTNEPPIIWLCVILGLPGIIGWTLPYRIFRFLVKRRSAEVAPLIEKKYEEIHEICEKGNALLH